MTRILTLLAIWAFAACLASSPAIAAVHTVGPGETLWSIAQADGISPQALAAANGLSADTHLVAHTALTIPGGRAGLPNQSTVAATSGEPAGDDTSPVSTGPVASGGYLVHPGDTLSAIAGYLGVSPSSLAAANGRALDGVLPAGVSLQTSPADPQAPSAGALSARGPSATPGFVSRSQIADVAAANGVPASLAQAVAWQESGFNNAAVSSANARGVMQIIPSTWRFVQRSLTSTPLDPFSPLGNVKGGVLLLHYLLNSSGGDSATAIAGYYQGLASVRRDGMLPDTRRYVANVLALRSSFGGP